MRNTILSCIVFLFIAAGILYPNPFGNNPDVIGDESYFLTTALLSIQSHSLPGWVWNTSTTYYGGPQAYIDTAVIVPAVGTILALSHFSMTQAKIWIALHTGELLHILRLVSAASALLALFCCYRLFKRRGIPRELMFELLLYLFLTLSNVLVIEFLHTAKMWSLYIVFVSVTGALFLAQEYYRSHFQKPFIAREKYAALLVWSGILTFFQSYFGAFTILLILSYAIALEHLSVRDVWVYARKRWYLFAIFALTQITFVYQSLLIAHQFNDLTSHTSSGSIDWYSRVMTPLIYALKEQPLSILYLFGLGAIFVLFVGKSPSIKEPRSRTYLSIAILHPVITYVFFYLLLGFNGTPRYGIILTLASVFSLTLLMTVLGMRYVKATLAAAFVLFCIINVHAIALYWKPSSETVLLGKIMHAYNTPKNVFITDHSARRMTLPINRTSLAYLDQDRKAMGRFSYLLENQALLPHMMSDFEPVTITAYLDEEQAADIAKFATTTDSVWIISSGCSGFCSTGELQAGTCFQIHIDTCSVLPQEVNTLPDFLSATELGYPYIVRRVH